jgi:hypothetical protein
MDYGKLDSSLSGALSDIEIGRRSPQDLLNVFIRIKPNPDAKQMQFLTDLGGIHGTPSNNTVLTAEISKEKIDILSELDWVIHIALATILHLASEGDHTT